MSEPKKPMAELFEAISNQEPLGSWNLVETCKELFRAQTIKYPNWRPTGPLQFQLASVLAVSRDITYTLLSPEDADAFFEILARADVAYAAKLAKPPKLCSFITELRRIQ